MLLLPSWFFFFARQSLQFISVAALTDRELEKKNLERKKKAKQAKNLKVIKQV